MPRTSIEPVEQEGKKLLTREELEDLKQGEDLEMEESISEDESLHTSDEEFENDQTYSEGFSCKGCGKDLEGEPVEEDFECECEDGVWCPDCAEEFVFEGDDGRIYCEDCEPEEEFKKK